MSNPDAPIYCSWCEYAFRRRVVMRPNGHGAVICPDCSMLMIVCTPRGRLKG